MSSGVETASAQWPQSLHAPRRPLGLAIHYGPSSELSRLQTIALSTTELAHPASWAPQHCFLRGGNQL